MPPKRLSSKDPKGLNLKKARFYMSVVSRCFKRESMKRKSGVKPVYGMDNTDDANGVDNVDDAKAEIRRAIQEQQKKAPLDVLEILRMQLEEIKQNYEAIGKLIDKEANVRMRRLIKRTEARITRAETDQVVGASMMSQS
ncbi:hypothetical protein JXB31_02030 [Candidatus Woesearchaeota archaeon]|nr:hypothetical protein [Candidatus Woesearchaeota archaeon]